MIKKRSFFFAILLIFKNLEHYLALAKMKKIVLTLVFLNTLITCLPANAQLLKKIQNAAQNAAQNIASQKVEKKTGQETEKALSGLMGGMFQPATTESSYQFSGYMTMDVFARDEKGNPETPVQFKYYMGEDLQVMGVSFQDPESKTNFTTITDSKNQAMVFLIEEANEKSSMAMGMDMVKMESLSEAEIEEDLDQLKLVKTGKTKTILGYTCLEYLVTSKDGKGNYWVTEKPISGMSVFSPQYNPLGENSGMNHYKTIFAYAPEGTFLEIVFTENDGSTVEMKFTAIEPKKATLFQMSDYPNMMSGNK